MRARHRLRAIPMMDIKVDNRDALNAMRDLRMTGGDEDMIEKAKAERFIGFGMMAWGACRYKAPLFALGQHIVDSLDGGAGRIKRGVIGGGADYCVAPIEDGQTVIGHFILQIKNVIFSMGAENVVEVGGVRLHALVFLEQWLKRL